MKRNLKFLAVLFALCSLFLLNQTISAQGRNAQGRNVQGRSAQGREEYTGTVISYNGPRLATAFFTLKINNQTSDAQAAEYLGVLQQNGQTRALDAIRNQNLGSFSVGGQLARTINVVRESTAADGRRRIFVVFERWQQFAEIRGGYRSVDYPFGVVELFIDERTGKGEGTYIAAARIRFDRDDNQVEIENFATYPAKLTQVRPNR
jgi:hypothetical protein